MTEFKNIFREDVEVPEIVQSKMENAFEQIKNEETAPAKKKASVKRGIFCRFRGQTAAAAAIVCMLALGGGAAYAAEHFGLLDFVGRLRDEIPEDATDLIETVNQQEFVKETDGSIIDCKVKEALCDSESISIVYEVSAKEKGKYLFVPTDALPEDSMLDWSDVADITAAEYAAEKGLTIVYIGGGIQNREELGIAESSMDFRSVSDDVMDIYVRSGKDTDTKNMEVSCIATARISDSDKVMRNEVHFTLEDKSSSEISVYKPESPEGNDVYTIQRVEVIQTDLKTYVDIFYKVLDPEAESELGIFFRILDENGEEQECVGGSGEVRQADGTEHIRLDLNKTDIGDHLILEGFDISEKTKYERTTLVKE